MKNYCVMYWLFFCNDQIERENLTKEEADRLCNELNNLNGDALYSGFYVKEM